MSDRFCLLFCFLLAALTGGCGPRALQTGRTLPVSLPPPVFVSGTAASGIDFALHSNHSPLTILETLGHGVALADFDGDGLLDVVLVGPNKVRLYRNLGQYRFQDVTASSGLAQEGFWQGVAAGDIDNDGKPDLYVCGYNCSALYHDEGGGRFRDITRAAGLLSRPARGGIGDWRASTGFADLDNDGKLDLYVCRYVAFGPHTPQFCDSGGQQTACSPEIYEPQRGLLYHNTGNSRFEDVTASAGLNKASGNGLGVAFGDYNGDGFTDIALANDEKPGDLFENKGGLRFIDRSQESGTALSASGHNHAGMGLDWMDYDADGKPDLFVTTFQNEAQNRCIKTWGGGQFTDTGTRAGLTGTLDTLVSFGCKFFDYDNDGWPDLIVASGHVNDNTAHLNGEHSTAAAPPVPQSRRHI